MPRKPQPTTLDDVVATIHRGLREFGYSGLTVDYTRESVIRALKGEASKENIIDMMAESQIKEAREQGGAVAFMMQRATEEAERLFPVNTSDQLTKPAARKRYGKERTPEQIAELDTQIDEALGLSNAVDEAIARQVKREKMEEQTTVTDPEDIEGLEEADDDEADDSEVDEAEVKETAKMKKAREAAERAAAREAAKAEREANRQRPCFCGCGTPTAARFKAGHDARLCGEHMVKLAVCTREGFVGKHEGPLSPGYSDPSYRDSLRPAKPEPVAAK